MYSICNVVAHTRVSISTFLIHVQREENTSHSANKQVSCTSTVVFNVHVYMCVFAVSWYGPHVQPVQPHVLTDTQASGARVRILLFTAE